MSGTEACKFYDAKIRVFSLNLRHKLSRLIELQSLHLPDAQSDAAIPRYYVADEDGVVEPCILAIGWCLEGRSSAEIVGILTVFIDTLPDETAVAYMDADAVVGADAVDGFEFGAVALLIDELIVGTTCQDLSVNQRTFEGTAGDGDDEAFAMRGGAYAEGSIDLDVELEGELKAGGVGGGGELR